MARTCDRCGYENADEAKFCLQCGAMLEQQAPDTEGQDPLIGKVLMGRYRVLRLLGEGGMGKVFLAEQKMGTATRKVAIKTLHAELSGDPQLVARFHRECETVIELHHPNTVQFFDFGELEDKSLFIIMEFIEGEDLAHRLQREGAIAPALADKLLIQICGSLNEAHDRGIVHRDLKPENVLLTHRGGQTDFVKVLDFGIAKRDEADNQAQAKLTKQGMVLGTPPYMSPEQFSGQLLDARSDIYSLGVMTYEMLTGQLPFQANTPWEWATKHLTEQPTPLSQHAAGAHLAPNKMNAVMRALAKNRDDRHPNVLAFMHEFTGMGDAQAAWTMATGVGVTGGTPPPGASAPGTHPLGTPQPMAQTGGHTPVTGHGPTGVAGGYVTPQPGMGTPAPGYGDTGSQGYAGAPAAHAGWGTGDAPVTLPQSGPSKRVGLLVAAVVLLGAGIGGAAFLMSQEDDDPVAGPLSTRTPTVPDAGLAGAQPVAASMTAAGDTPSMAPGAIQPAMNAAAMDTAAMDTAAMNTAAMDTADSDASDSPGAMTEAAMGATAMTTMRANANATRARALASQAQSAVAAGQIDQAIAALSSAQGLVGRRDRSLRAARSALGQRGSRQIGILLQQGRCGPAQELYQKLARVGAQGPSGSQFGDWCRRP